MVKKKRADSSPPSSRAGSRSGTPRKRPKPLEDLIPARKTPSQKSGKSVTVDLGKLGVLAGSPEAVAREICHLASDEENRRKADQLLKQAETLDPLSVLVPILRGDRAARPDLALRHYRKALTLAEDQWEAAGRRRRSISRDDPALQDLETAHRAMASVLESQRRPAEAIPHYETILSLDPDDATAIEALALALLSAQRVSEAAEVVARSDLPTYFTKALVEFCRRGPTPVAAGFLKKGHTENPHVAPLLLGDEQFEDVLPDDVAPGSSGAAQLYLLRAMPLWRDTPGAVTWLRQVLGKELGARKPTLKQRRQQAQELLREIRAVKHIDFEPWRLSVRPLHAEPGGRGGQLAVLTNEAGDKLYQSTVFDDVPNTEMMLELLLDAAEERKVRPPEILFDDPRLLRRIEATLKSNGIDSRVVEHMSTLDHSLDDLRSQVVQSLDQGEPVRAAELERVPQTEDVWFVDSQRLPRWVENRENRYVRLQSIMVVSQAAGAIIAQRVEAAEEHLPELVWKTVAHAMTHPFVGPQQRPAELRVRTHDLRIALEERLRPLSVRCVVTDEFASFDEAHNLLVKSLAEDSDDQDEFSLVRAGHSLASIEALFRVASQFYRAAPWKTTPPDLTIEVQGGRWKKPRYAVVIGQSGLLQGMCIYDAQADLAKSMAAEAEIDDVSAVNLFFDEPQALPISDHDAYLDHNWPVASPEGFPIVIRVRRRRRPSTPSKEDLEMLTAVAAALPDFLKGKKGTQTVETVAGPLTLTKVNAEPKKRKGKGKS